MKKTIFIVDDNRAILDCLGLMLKEEGYNTVKLGSGVEFYKKIKTTLPNFIFLDIWLTDTSGEEILSFLKKNEKTKKIPVVIITALSDGHKIIKKHKIEGFLPKPFNMEDVIKVTEKYLG